jgi:hypothetical protein
VDDEEDKEDVVKSQSPVEDERRRVQVEEEEEEDEDDEHDHRLATVHTPGNFRMRFGWCWYSGPILIDRTVLTGIPLTVVFLPSAQTPLPLAAAHPPSQPSYGCREDWSKGRNGVGA